MIFIVGWRGEPGIYDEPQHIYQREVTIKLLEDMGIKTFAIKKDTTEEVIQAMEEYRERSYCINNGQGQQNYMEYLREID